MTTDAERNESEKKAARAAVSALVSTQNPDLVKMGIAMMPQEDKDDVAAIAARVRWGVEEAKTLVDTYPRLGVWLGGDKITTTVLGGWLAMSDALESLMTLVKSDRDKIALFFDTIILDDDAFSVSMTLLMMLPIMVKNGGGEGLLDPTMHDGILDEFIRSLHAVPHVPEFPDTPEALREKLVAVFG